MKKLMITAAAALCATLAVNAEGVESGIVGYNTVTVNKEWSIFAVNFEGVSGGSLTIQEAFPVQEGMTKGMTILDADQIQVMKSEGGYKTYYLSNGKYKQMGQEKYDATIDGKWRDAEVSARTPATAPLAPGQAFWYKAKAYATPYTLTVAGAVPDDPSVTITINKEWSHIANPYPFELSLNDGIGCQTGMTKGMTLLDADQIQIPKADGGYKTYYLSNGKYKQMGQEKYDAAIDGKWRDAEVSARTPTDAAISVGQGAWYKRAGSDDFEFVILGQ